MFCRHSAKIRKHCVLKATLVETSVTTKYCKGFPDWCKAAPGVPDNKADFLR